jgi:hypothetical protein
MFPEILPSIARVLASDRSQNLTEKSANSGRYRARTHKKRTPVSMNQEEPVGALASGYRRQQPRRLSL